MKKNLRLYNLIAITVLLISACNLPRNNSEADTASTAAALTVSALLSATPAVVGGVTSTPSLTPVSPATLTPVPVLTNTPVPTATSNCNAMQFVTDVTYPDNTVVVPGQVFTKTWRLKNIGTCAWTPSYAVVFSAGNAMNGPSTQALAGNINPGQTLDVSVNLTAPATTGDFRGDWKIRDASGVLFGAFYVQIRVQNTPTITNTSAPAFAVTNVVFSVTGTCPNFSYTYSVTTNGPGTVNLHRVFSDGGTDTLPVTMTFGAAGTQTSPSISVFMGLAGTTTWTDIFIDTPNHQQFGRASFTCP